MADKSIAELRKIYHIFAKFYTDVDFKDDSGVARGNNSRLFADVIRNGHENDPIDAYIIMINPGSCKPVLDSGVLEEYSFYKDMDIIEAVSDPAQKCVMLLMEEGNLNKIRMLNLIDYADGKIGNAIQVMSGENAVNKSLFSIDRKKEREMLMAYDVPIIVAWGLDKKCESLKKQAFECLDKDRIVGWHVDDKGDYAYKYIKPYRVSEQKIIRDYLLKEMHFT